MEREGGKRRGMKGGEGKDRDREGGEAVRGPPHLLLHGFSEPLQPSWGVDQNVGHVPVPAPRQLEDLVLLHDGHLVIVQLRPLSWGGRGEEGRGGER